MPLLHLDSEPIMVVVRQLALAWFMNPLNMQAEYAQIQTCKTWSIWEKNSARNTKSCWKKVMDKAFVKANMRAIKKQED